MDPKSSNTDTPHLYMEGEAPPLALIEELINSRMSELYTNARERYEATKSALDDDPTNTRLQRKLKWDHNRVKAIRERPRAVSLRWYNTINSEYMHRLRKESTRDDMEYMLNMYSTESMGCGPCLPCDQYSVDWFRDEYDAFYHKFLIQIVGRRIIDKICE